MKQWWKKVWCALRGHPYPVNVPERDYDEPVLLWPPPYCSHCGKQFWPPRGMHS